MNFIEATLAGEHNRVVVDAGPFHLEMPKDLVPHARDWIGRRVIFGIRPEDIQDRAMASTAAPTWTIRALVEVHEPLGSDVILYLTAGKHSFVARVDARTEARMGQHIDVVVNMRKLHLFNPETQEAVI